MKRIKITYYPFECWRISKPMTDEEAQRMYNKACTLHAGDSTKIEIIKA